MVQPNAPVEIYQLHILERFQYGRIDRRKLNRRLKQYAQGDEEWLWE
jgi:hypothetical protein